MALLSDVKISIECQRVVERERIFMGQQYKFSVAYGSIIPNTISTAVEAAHSSLLSPTLDCTQRQLSHRALIEVTPRVGIDPRGESGRLNKHVRDFVAMHISIPRLALQSYAASCRCRKARMPQHVNSEP